MIEEKLISKVSSIIRCNAKNLESAFMICKAKGFLDKEELLQLEESTIPIRLIISNVMNTSIDEVNDIIWKRRISYEDLLCIIGIYTQDLLAMCKDSYIRRFKN